jgi:hypothetical protein
MLLSGAWGKVIHEKNRIGLDIFYYATLLHLTPSDFAWIESRTVATVTMAIRHSNHSDRFNPPGSKDNYPQSTVEIKGKVPTE